MRKLLFFGWVLLLSGCNWLTPKETLRAQYVQKELQAIDWESVDQFPHFKICDETALKADQQGCFEREIRKELSLIINKIAAQDSLQISGSYTFLVVVNTQGQFELDLRQQQTVSTTETAVFLSALAAEVQQLSPIGPALKHGVPVATQYQIPIEIHLD